MWTILTEQVTKQRKARFVIFHGVGHVHHVVKVDRIVLCLAKLHRKLVRRI